MSESTRTLKAEDPAGWYYLRWQEDRYGVLKWTGSMVIEEGKRWDPKYYEVLSGPLMTKEDFEQTPRVRRWMEMEDLARTFCEESARPNTTDWHFARGQLEAILDPPVLFTPPPKPELKLWRTFSGNVYWGTEQENSIHSAIDGRCCLKGEAVELDPTTGQPIGERNS